MPIPTNNSRPAIPYDPDQVLPYYNRYQALGKVPPTAQQLDGDFNRMVDLVNALARAINDTAAGIFPGADNPINANKLPTTDGQGNVSWTHVTPQNLADNAVQTRHIQDAAITSSKIQVQAVGTNQIADGNVTTAKIIDNAVVTAKIADNAVTTVKMLDSNVTTAKIAEKCVVTDKLADSSVTTTKVADNSITTAKIADNAITTTKIADANVTTAKIIDQAITRPKIAPDVLTPPAAKPHQLSAASSLIYTNPAVQQFHPSAAKFWCSFNGSLSGTNAPIAGYNVASVTRNGVGLYTITFSTQFASSNYIVVGNCQSCNIYNAIIIVINSLTTNNCVITTVYGAGNSIIDSGINFIVGYGTQ